VSLTATARLTWTRNGSVLTSVVLACSESTVDRQRVVQPHQANDWHLTIDIIEGKEQVSCQFDREFRRDRRQRIDENCVVHSPGWARFRLLR
jgi:hypothetical protein